MTQLERQVPAEVLEVFHARLARRRATVEAVGRAYEALALGERYGVSLRQARAHVEALRRRGSAQAEAVLSGRGKSGARGGRREAWMTRLSCAGQIARQLCEETGEDEEARIQRGARLIVVSRIVEALSREDAELPTSELASLCRAYVAQQKVAPGGSSGEEAARADAIVDEAALRAAVQEIYGVPQQEGASERAARASSATQATE